MIIYVVFIYEVTNEKKNHRTEKKFDIAFGNHALGSQPTD